MTGFFFFFILSKAGELLTPEKLWKLKVRKIGIDLVTGKFSRNERAYAQSLYLKRYSWVW
ncbi:hypothetical protein A3L08_05255 [Thermococcus pacificus]|uniref:Uncharacterized protein n=1 Tax=Thermococcus pacificus TaxID=71998 RepID=A0A218P7K3_9EURY|nr:hypothetical protein A3L08_05255 [Thermococcus pacificus]